MGKLVRLELFNFKSYKGHHTLLFGDSFFTSIIGPNGSGKSNSMDAISFVLGIKSSHLRSSHLRDLVYRGRVLRTSIINGDGSASAPAANGQANGDGEQILDDDDGAGTQNGTQRGRSERHDPKSAWVMAVYEDDAGDEHHWKRTITSQGVSEYRINNRVVSAQNYNDALEAENILIKARNFLVFQGDVEAIASQSPKDLTRLIEQISGSLEYKAEYERLKEAAEQAAEHQNYNLNRRRGINSEIKQYQEQKREADNYAKKADDRDQALVTHVLWKLFHFQRVVEESGAEIAKHQQELKEFRRGIERYDQALEDARREQAKVGRDVGKAERAIKRMERDIEGKENELVPIDEKIDLTGRNVRTYAAKIAEIAKERDGQSSTVDRLKKDLAVVGKAQDRWEADRKKTERSEGRALSDEDLQEYSKLKEQVNTRTSANQTKLDALARRRKTDEETVESLKSKYESTQWQIQKLEEGIRETTERKDAINAQVKQSAKEMDGKKKEFNNLTSERLRTAQKQTELDEKLQEVLRTLLEADDGRRQSEREVRTRDTVAALKRIFPGVKGRVSDLCKLKLKKYGDAVSTVLGRNFDAVVVDSEKTAKECIQYLRDQRSGQATFIPLETIQVKPVNSNLKGLHQGVRLAIDTIEYDHAVERAMSYACGNAVVCDDLKLAKWVCYDKGVEAKAVTLDGTVIHKGGLMTGGRGPGQHNSRRWEDAEVENLRRLKDKLLGELSALPRGNRRGVAEETLQGELTGLEERISYAREEVKALERNLASRKKELDFARRELKDFQPKYDEKSKELRGLKDNLREFQDAVGEVEDEVFADFCRRLGYHDIREYEAQQGSRQQEAAQKQLEFTMQKSKLENQLSFENQRLQSTVDRVRRLEEKSRRDEDLIAALEAEKEAIQGELDTMTAELEQLQDQHEQQKARYAKKGERVAEQRREVQMRTKEVEGTLRAVAALEAEVQRTAAGRYALLRRCKLEEIDLPLARGSANLDRLPIDELLQGGNADEMDVDEEPGSDAARGAGVQDYGIQVDFGGLEDDLKENADEKLDEELQEKMAAIASELDKMAPNMRAIERLEGVESRLKSTEKDFEDARRQAKKARDDFQDVKEQRFELFSKAFSHISEQIGQVYKDLTKSANLPLGGQAYLDMEDSDEPYLDGIKYHAMPPLKRFRDMEHLSGGEKTMAALALLFAVHSYQPSPFFVLDEVDAALDNANVAKIANYIRDHAGPGMQFIVISLKAGLFQSSEALVGIYRDQAANSSKALTLDVSATRWRSRKGGQDLETDDEQLRKYQ
ncbi:MAG: Structural maintenance of chromosomes protein 1 [Thelocarpon impressellum]|nr:MAG: Structural maintenance of chromosomes protein 1 [Thelocarpon impressellum]